MSGALPERYRDEFPVRDNRVFFNHAAVGPIPTRTADAIDQTASEQRDHACARYDIWEERVDRARAGAAALLGADRRDVAFVKNTTSGLLIAAEGIPWREGDNVVTSSVEFPANIYPWLNLARRGVDTRMVDPVDGRILIDDIARAMDARTRAVTISWVQYGNGFRIDLAALSQLCHDRGAYLVVDAIQGLGAIPLDVRASGVDLIAADGHKWLLSVEGCGLLYVSQRMLAEMSPVNVGWMSVEDATDFGNYDLTLRAGAGRFEEGSHNMIGVHALGASIGLLLEAGTDAVWRQVSKLTERLVEGLARLDCEVISPPGANERSGIVSFTKPRMEASQIVGRLAEESIDVAERNQAVRVSPHFYNDAGEIDALLDVLASM